jgi:hypothetical protein
MLIAGLGFYSLSQAQPGPIMGASRPYFVSSRTLCSTIQTCRFCGDTVGLITGLVYRKVPFHMQRAQSGSYLFGLAPIIPSDIKPSPNTMGLRPFIAPVGFSL